MLELLIENGASIMLENRNSAGQTLLMRIVLDDNIENRERIVMVRYLLDSGADPMVSNAQGSLIKQVQQKQRDEIVNLLLKAGGE